VAWRCKTANDIESVPNTVSRRSKYSYLERIVQALCVSANIHSSQYNVVSGYASATEVLSGWPLGLESHGIFRKTIFQAWIVMENSKGHGKSWKVMDKSRIMLWNFYNCTEKFCNEYEQWVCRQFSLLQPAGTVTTNSGMHSYVMFCLFLEKYSADRSWELI